MLNLKKTTGERVRRRSAVHLPDPVAAGQGESRQGVSDAAGYSAAVVIGLLAGKAKHSDAVCASDIGAHPVVKEILNLVAI